MSRFALCPILRTVVWELSFQIEIRAGYSTIALTAAVQRYSGFVERLFHVTSRERWRRFTRDSPVSETRVVSSIPIADLEDIVSMARLYVAADEDEDF